MKRLYFNCQFLSEVILNESLKTKGYSDMLDYVPGNKFLGILARNFSKFENPNHLFFNGELKFSDAHLSIEGKRSHKIPLNWEYDKLAKTKEPGQLSGAKSENKIFKQQRDGFYLNANGQDLILKPSISFKLKSAYDKDKRASKESALFGFYHIVPGTMWQFFVDTPEHLVSTVKEELIGKQFIGKSISAEFGQAEITLAKEEELNQALNPITSDFSLYLDSNLCYFDEFGNNTPLPFHLDINGQKIEIDFTKSKIRYKTIQSWNAKRNTYNTDKLVVTKGSVLFLKNTSTIELANEIYLGKFISEGYGRCLLNFELVTMLPPALELNHAIQKAPKAELNKLSDKEQLLLKILEGKTHKQNTEQTLFFSIRDFAEHNKDKFNSLSSSQWGVIRRLAKRATDYASFSEFVFGKNGFTMHGKSESDWKKSNRRNTLQSFLEGNQSLNDDEKLQLAEQLASHMQKQTNQK